MNAAIAASLALVAAIAGSSLLVVDQLSLPLVSVDALTGKCIRIESPAGYLPCSKMPDRYVQQRVYQPPATEFRDPPVFDIAGVQR